MKPGNASGGPGLPGSCGPAPPTSPRRPPSTPPSRSGKRALRKSATQVANNPIKEKITPRGGDSCPHFTETVEVDSRRIGLTCDGTIEVHDSGHRLSGVPRLGYLERAK